TALHRTGRKARVADFRLDFFRRNSEMFGGDYGHHSVSSRPDVGDGARDISRAVGSERDYHRRRLLPGAPGAGRHAPADEQAPVAHRARLEFAVFPAELFRAQTVTLAQRLGR